MSNAVALFGEKSDHIPAHFVQDGNLGNENVTQDDVQIPRLSVLQALSPQVETVEGARPGLLHNSITDELYESVYLINLFYAKEFAVFKRRNLGGGFHGTYDSLEAASAHITTLQGNPDDYDVSETARHTCLLLNEKGEPQSPVQLLMKSTQLAVSRNWNSQITLKGEGAPRFATVWELATERRSNTHGSWYVLKPEFAGYAPEALYEEAKDLYTTFRQTQ